MTNIELSLLLIECADELQEYRNAPIHLGHVTYDRLKALELKARKAAQEVIKSRELNPLEDDLK